MIRRPLTKSRIVADTAVAYAMRDTSPATDDERIGPAAAKDQIKLHHAAAEGTVQTNVQAVVGNGIMPTINRREYRASCCERDHSTGCRGRVDCTDHRRASCHGRCAGYCGADAVLYMSRRLLIP